MSHFETNPKALKDLLSQINMGELALPNFQRDFVWDPGATEELIESIMRKYPAGSLLFLKHDGTGFDVREFEGAPKLSSKSSASYLVLDGQQRMTSLYQAFFGKGDHRFFLDLKVLGDSEDIEEAVWHETTVRCERQKLSTIAVQAERLICPLEVLMGRKGGFHAWVDEIMEQRTEKGEEAREIRNELREVHEKWIVPILDYHFPVITLASSTPLSAVCKMFETLNRRGVKLGPFELLMARAFASQVSLRDLWDKALVDYPVLEDYKIDPYYLLQVVSLLKAHTIKRADVLNLSASIITDNWEKSVHGLGRSLEFLRKELGILSAELIPYNTMLVPLAAMWTELEEMKGPQVGASREKLSQWFWASVFSQAYEKGPSSRAVSDYKELVTWIVENGLEPRALRGISFSPAMFFEVTPKQRALYRGTIALAISSGALDFHKAEKLTFDYLESNKVDDHHLFPQNFLKGKKVPEARVNCVLNRTLIDKVTNIRISDKAPSKYVNEMVKDLGEDKVKKIFSSHVISFESLKKDDFEEFLAVRSKELFGELQKKLNRSVPETAPVIEEEDDTFDEEDSSPRDRVDQSLVNVHPEKFLEDQPKWVDQHFQKLTKELQSINPEIWWKLKKRSLSFFSPSKHFLTVRISKNGLRMTAFTRGKSIPGVEPIIQKDRGGELWGRFSLGKEDDFKKVMDTLRFSLTQMEEALRAGEATAWWAKSRDKKVA
ncbi:MAG: DUF262 domain-containing protein [Bdellovibrionaceae bacterium]|nr:DUF262 domain-containing protein [Pseudobdellovibrionaceae bacterium]